MDWAVWIGIVVCLSQSAIFSGLNLGMLGPSRLRLQVAAAGGHKGARRVLELRHDFHLLLTTVLWGNVAVNTLLALLADSILTGVAAFFVSTIGITLFGEIVPQAYVSRHALAVGGALAPVIRVYRFFLLPVAWPTARLLDRMVGKERMGLFLEHDLREMLRLHILDPSSDVTHVEGRGALNFLALDDRHLGQEAGPLEPASVVSLPTTGGRVRFPSFQASAADPFLVQIHRSRRTWVVIIDEDGRPRLVLNASAFLRAVLMNVGSVDPHDFCHEPVVITDPACKLESVLGEIRLLARRPGEDRMDFGPVLLWTPNDKRILTGAHLLRNLLRGIAEP